MAITKLNDDKDNNKYNEVIDVSSDDTSMIFLKKLVEKVDEAIDLANTHITKMAANDAKTGITTAQANAITANTAKTGITSQQAADIANNKANIGNKLEVVPNVNGTNQQRLLCGVVENRGVYTLNFSYEDTVKGQRVRKTGSIQLK